MKKAIIVLLILVFALNVAAEGLSVKGITITSINYFPLHKNFMDNNYVMPSCRYALNNDTLENEFIAHIRSSGLNASRGFGLCSSSGVSFQEGNINYTFDGVWLVAEQQLDNGSEWLNLTEALPLNEIRISELKNNPCKEAREKVQDAGCYNVMTLIHFKETDPKKLFLEDSSMFAGEDDFVNHEYALSIGALLRQHDINNFKISASQYSSGGDTRYVYFIPDDTQDAERRVLLVMNESYPMIDNSGFRRYFTLYDYSRYNEDEGIPQIELILTEAMLFREELTNKRNILIERTNSLLGWKERLAYLNTNRSDLLIDYELKYNELSRRFTSVQKTYIKERNLMENNELEIRLYSEEITPQLDNLSRKIDNTKKNLEDIETIQDSVRNIYYGELGAAVSERAIHESWDMTNNSVIAAHNDTLTAVNTAHIDSSLSLLFVVDTLLVTIVLEAIGRKILKKGIPQIITFFLIFILTAFTIGCLLFPSLMKFKVGGLFDLYYIILFLQGMIILALLITLFFYKTEEELNKLELFAMSNSLNAKLDALNKGDQKLSELQSESNEYTQELIDLNNKSNRDLLEKLENLIEWDRRTVDLQSGSVKLLKELADLNKKGNQELMEKLERLVEQDKKLSVESNKLLGKLIMLKKNDLTSKPFRRKGQ
jgi:hypothetical protein